ncbi:MAG: PIN domain-containing protein [Chloroflexota bacterium]|nr:PIN domain-containing protein [Chloroflexota bacterium]
MNNAFLDTNVIIRHLLRDNPDQSSRSSRLVGSIADGIVDVAISDTVVFEAVFVLNQIYKISRSEVADELTVLLNIPGISLNTKSEILATLRYWARQSPLSFADCYHLVTAESLGLDMIYSFDKKMGRYPGVERIEP